MKNFFIKSRRRYVARRGGSGGSDFNTAFHKGWRGFPKRLRASLCSPKKATTNERRMMMKYKLFKEPAWVREDFCAGSLRE